MRADDDVKRSSNVTFWSMLETPVNGRTHGDLAHDERASDDGSSDVNYSSHDVTILPEQVATSVRLANKFLQRVRGGTAVKQQTVNNLSLADELMLCTQRAATRHTTSRRLHDSSERFIRKSLSFSQPDATSGSEDDDDSIIDGESRSSTGEWPDVNEADATTPGELLGVIRQLADRRKYLHQLVDRWYDKLMLQLDVLQRHGDVKQDRYMYVAVKQQRSVLI